jgi:hypothetical protein
MFKQHPLSHVSCCSRGCQNAKKELAAKELAAELAAKERTAEGYEKAMRRVLLLLPRRLPAESIDDTDDVRYTMSDFGTFPTHAMLTLLLDKCIHNVLSHY